MSVFKGLSTALAAALVIGGAALADADKYDVALAACKAAAAEKLGVAVDALSVERPSYRTAGRTVRVNARLAVEGETGKRSLACKADTSTGEADVKLGEPK